MKGGRRESFIEEALEKKKAEKGEGRGCLRVPDRGGTQKSAEQRREGCHQTGRSEKKKGGKTLTLGRENLKKRKMLISQRSSRTQRGNA